MPVQLPQPFQAHCLDVAIMKRQINRAWQLHGHRMIRRNRARSGSMSWDGKCSKPVVRGNRPIAEIQVARRDIRFLGPPPPRAAPPQAADRIAEKRRERTLLYISLTAEHEIPSRMSIANRYRASPPTAPAEPAIYIVAAGAPCPISSAPPQPCAPQLGGSDHAVSTEPGYTSGGIAIGVAFRLAAGRSGAAGQIQPSLVRPQCFIHHCPCAVAATWSTVQIPSGPAP